MNQLYGKPDVLSAMFYSPHNNTNVAGRHNRRRLLPWPAYAFGIVGVALLGGLLWWYTRPPPSLDLIRLWTEYELWDRADEAIKRYLRAWPQDDEALMLAARIAAAKGELERCAELLSLVPDYSALKCAALVRQGQALRQIGYGRRAEEVLREAVRLADQMGPAGVSYAQAARAELVSLLRLEARDDEARQLLWEMYPTHR